jgi:hypothetical protein
MEGTGAVIRSIKLVSCALSLAVVMTGLAQTTASASAAGSKQHCATQSLSVTVLGSTTMVNSHVDNECGRNGLFIIGYRLSGPCAHSKAFSIRLPSVPVDVVTNFSTPCEGAYHLRQRVTGNGSVVGQSFAGFEVEGGG